MHAIGYPYTTSFLIYEIYSTTFLNASWHAPMVRVNVETLRVFFKVCGLILHRISILKYVGDRN